MQELLYEFPLVELAVYLPPWVDALPAEHPIKSGLYESISRQAGQLQHIRQLEGYLQQLEGDEHLQSVCALQIDLGTGRAAAELQVHRKLFYETLTQRSGLAISDDGDLMELLTELAAVKKAYESIAPALQAAQETGYGIVMPGMEELELEEPELVRQGSRFGVKLKANAPSLHLVRVDIQTEVSPIVGTEKQSEELVKYLLHEFEEDPVKIWDSNIFGKSLHELVNEGLHNKLYRMPADARLRLQETIERIINEGCNGLICIIL